jgi:hypothetical protein
MVWFFFFFFFFRPFSTGCPGLIPGFFIKKKISALLWRAEGRRYPLVETKAEYEIYPKTDVKNLQEVPAK